MKTPDLLFKRLQTTFLLEKAETTTSFRQNFEENLFLQRGQPPFSLWSILNAEDVPTLKISLKTSLSQ